MPASRLERWRDPHKSERARILVQEQVGRGRLFASGPLLWVLEGWVRP